MDFGEALTMTLPPRHFYETERDARVRAEQEQATRDRITYAHELLSKAVSVGPAELRKLSREGAAFYASDVARAGLTLGEAHAAGMHVG
jgi:ribosomal protein L13E